jgi:predicted ester cyclase
MFVQEQEGKDMERKSASANPAKEIAEKFVKAEEEAWIKGNVDALDEVEDPNIVIHGVGGMPDIVGRDGHKQFITGARQAFAGVRHEFLDITGSGDIAAFRYTERFTYDKELPGFPPPTGKSVYYPGAMFLHIKNNRIVEIYMVWDTMSLNQVLGLVPTP